MFDLQFSFAPLCLGYADIIVDSVLCTFVLQEVVEETAASNGLDGPRFLVCAGPRDANPWCMTISWHMISIYKVIQTHT